MRTSESEGRYKSMILVRIQDLKFLDERAANWVGTSNPPHQFAYAASGRSERGNGKNSFSSAAETVSTCSSYRSANAPMISSTITSGAEAPAVMPSVLMPSNLDQSRSPARCARTAIGQPSRSATSRKRWEFDEFGAPTTIRASTTGATFFTASWRLVVA